MAMHQQQANSKRGSPGQTVGTGDLTDELNMQGGAGDIQVMVQGSLVLLLAAAAPLSALKERAPAEAVACFVRFQLVSPPAVALASLAHAWRLLHLGGETWMLVAIWMLAATWMMAAIWMLAWALGRTLVQRAAGHCASSVCPPSPR